MDELAAWLALARTSGLHAGQLTSLLARVGSVCEIVNADRRLLLEAGATPAVVRSLAAPDRERLERDLRWLEHPSHHLVVWGSAAYPVLLQELADAPIALFVSGDAACLSTPQLAMVGSRNPTPSGRATAEAFATHLVRCGLTITSGLAMGIDAASHRGALSAGGKTIAVCGTGLDVIYPRSSTQLAEQIEAQGALVSEFPPGIGASRHHFPQRNRIISGLSLGTLVVEAAVHSGSLITARQAGEQGREVFAIPGSIHNPMARGCHQLIRQGAKLVESADDILSELGPLTALLVGSSLTEGADDTGVSGTELDKAYKMLLDALGFEPAGVDLLAARTGLSAQEVASMLLILELEGRIESFPGGLFVRARPEAAK